MTAPAKQSPGPNARIAGAIYVAVFVAGGLALGSRGTVGAVAGIAAGALYIAVTWLFYGIFKPVNKSISLVAACVSFAGIAAGPLQRTVNPLVFFGVYCLLIGYLVFRSTFLPRFLGVLMAFAGLGWLTFASPALGRTLYPYNLVPGLVGEGALTLWLLVAGVDTTKWESSRREEQVHV